MPLNASRIGDLDDDGPDAMITGSPDVFTNYRNACRVGDLDDDGPDMMITGSPTVFINFRNATRIGDLDDDGPDMMITGSPDVFIGSHCYGSTQKFPIVRTPIVLIPVAPGVFSLNGDIIYDQTPYGQAASIKSEIGYDPGIPGNKETGDAPPLEDAPPDEKPPEPVNCGGFNEPITAEDMAKQVSTHFKLSNCKEMPVAQRGLKSSEIACNWKALCINILDKVRDAGFKFNITSGFRSAGRDSGGDHGIGCAADIQVTSVEETKRMFKWMVDAGLPFSQIIYEKSGNSGFGWVHVAYGGKGPKGAARTMWTYSGGKPYGIGGANGETLPPELK